MKVPRRWLVVTFGLLALSAVLYATAPTSQQKVKASLDFLHLGGGEKVYPKASEGLLRSNSTRHPKSYKGAVFALDYVCSLLADGCSNPALACLSHSRASRYQRQPSAAFPSSSTHFYLYVLTRPTLCLRQLPDRHYITGFQCVASLLLSLLSRRGGAFFPPRPAPTPCLLCSCPFPLIRQTPDVSLPPLQGFRLEQPSL